MEHLRVLFTVALGALVRYRGLAQLLDRRRRPPWARLNPEAAYHAGLMEGVASALDLTVTELLERIGVDDRSGPE